MTRDARPSPRPPALRNPAPALVVILAVALLLRLREPLSSDIIGAEDPYVHMVRTWDLVNGRGFTDDYPPGFTVFLAPFALLGPAAFYETARFLPPVLGVIEVLGVFVLARRYLDPLAALAAAAGVAVMPENIFRTNLLFPTALDLAILPFLLLSVLRASEGDARAAVVAVALLAFLTVTHPWAVALILPPLAVAFLLLVARGGARAWPMGIVASVAAVFVLAAFGVAGVWAPTAMDVAWARLAGLAADPSSILPLPRHVTPVRMLTLPLVLLAFPGAMVALVRRGRLDLMALVWTMTLLPLVLVDWFGVWFLPHRTVAYLSLGVALLAALPVDVLAKRLAAGAARPQAAGARAPVAAATLAVLLVVTVPAGASTQYWYRIYDDQDFAAWDALASSDTPMVMASSWQTAVGYRAVTGKPSAFHPGFFNDEAVRADWLRRHPGLIVVVDEHAVEHGLATHFTDSWEVAGVWGDTTAYRAPQ